MINIVEHIKNNDIDAANKENQFTKELQANHVSKIYNMQPGHLRKEPRFGEEYCATNAC